jgi:ribose 5-phosphate isomerase B
MSAPLILSLGSDHAGFALKSALVAQLKTLGIQVLDRGTHSAESCHYPTYPQAVGADVFSGPARFGILICSTGIGISIAANKIPGIRAALVHKVEMATLARQHNDANVLCFGARYATPEFAAESLAAFLKAEFEGGRHDIRLSMLEPKPPR